MSNHLTIRSLHFALRTLYRYDLGRNARRVAEAKALKNSVTVYFYIANVIKGRWPEAEAMIAAHPSAAYYYAKDVIKGRWPEAEPTIACDSKWAATYARRVLHDPDPYTWAARRIA